MSSEMQEAIITIKAFVAGTSAPSDWDDFISLRAIDPDVERLRQFCVQLRDDYPPTRRTDYCSDAGLARLMECVRAIEGEQRDTL